MTDQLLEFVKINTFTHYFLFYAFNFLYNHTNANCDENVLKSYYGKHSKAIEQSSIILDFIFFHNSYRFTI